MSYEEKYYRIQTFDGVRDNFPIWEPKFRAKSNKRGTLKILDGTSIVPSKSDYETAYVVPEATRTADQTDIIDRYKLNTSAYADLLLAIEGKTTRGRIAFAIVTGSITTENPDGNARIAWTRLTSKYAPQTSYKFMKLEKEFTNSRLRSEMADPDVWLTRLEGLRTDMNKCTITGKTDKSETDLIIHVLANLPEGYEVTVNDISNDIKANRNISVEDVREQLNARFDWIKDHAKESERSPNEKALAELFGKLDEAALVAFVKRFKGSCNKCGKYGHKGVDCRGGGSKKSPTFKSQDDTNERFKGKCFYCGIIGHRKIDCKKFAAKDKTQRELAHLAQGESDDSRRMSLEDTEEDYNDELCFISGIQELQRPDQFAERKPKRKRTVTFNNHVMVRYTHVSPLGPRESEEEFQLSGRPSKRLKKKSSLEVLIEDNDVQELTEMCLVGTDDGQSYEIDEQTYTACRSKKQKDWAESCTIDGDRYPSFTNMTMYGDSCASCHLDNNDAGMTDVEDIYERIGGIGGSILATKKGRKSYKFVQVDGSSVVREFYPVKYGKDATKLLSINRELSGGAVLKSDARNSLVLTYPNGDVIVCDRRMKTKDGWVPGVEVEDVIDDVLLLAKEQKPKNVNINDYHEQLGHPNMVITKTTAVARNINLTGTVQPCGDCMIGKARQKNVPKATVPRSTVPGERLFIDISSPRVKSYGGSRHWLLVLDDATDLPFGFFLSHKDLLKTQLIPFIKNLKAQYNITVKIIRCDNAGENVAFEKAAKDEGLGLKFEYTAVNTPQQNGRVERKLQTLYGRVRSTLVGSGIQLPDRNHLWPEAANVVTDLDSILVRDGSTSSSEQFFGKGVKSHISSTKKFGEPCIVTDRTAIKAKLSDRGKAGNWVGYAKGHPKDTYRIFNPKTKRVILSRDVMFAGKQNKVVSPVTPELADSDDEESDSDSDDEFGCLSKTNSKRLE